MSFRAALESEFRNSELGAGWLSEERSDSICEHFELMVKWNKTHNLTRIVEPAEAARKHYLDCALAMEKTKEHFGDIKNIFDIGSGAGFPGFLASHIWPDSQHYWVEPAQKRASFLTMVRRDNVEVDVTRAEDNCWPDGDVLVVSRATFPWNEWGKVFDSVPDTTLLKVSLMVAPEVAESWEKYSQRVKLSEPSIARYQLGDSDGYCVMGTKYNRS